MCTPHHIENQSRARIWIAVANVNVGGVVILGA